MAESPKESLGGTKERKYPHRESNPDLEFRKPLFYPLNYGDQRRGILPRWQGASKPEIRWRIRLTIAFALSEPPASEREEPNQQT